MYYDPCYRDPPIRYPLILNCFRSPNDSLIAACASFVGLKDSNAKVSNARLGPQYNGYYLVVPRNEGRPLYIDPKML